MRFQSEFKTIHSEIEKLKKRDQHHIVDEAKFVTLKNEILAIFKAMFGETSREYKVVKLTNSPATVIKVMNHIAARNEMQTNTNIAVSM